MFDIKKVVLKKLFQKKPLLPKKVLHFKIYVAQVDIRCPFVTNPVQFLNYT